MDKVVIPQSLLTSRLEQVHQRSDDFVRVYANHLNLSISVWDVTINFGIDDGETPEGKSIIKEKVRINMSKEMAKVFHDLLGLHLQVYESSLGEIKLPDLDQAKALRDKKSPPAPKAKSTKAKS